MVQPWHTVHLWTWTWSYLGGRRGESVWSLQNMFIHKATCHLWDHQAAFPPLVFHSADSLPHFLRRNPQFTWSYEIMQLLLSTIFHSSVGSLMTPYPLELLVVDRRARLQWNIQLIPQSDSLGMLSDGIIQPEKVTITQFQQATFWDKWHGSILFLFIIWRVRISITNWSPVSQK